MKQLFLLRHGDADPDGPVTWSHDSRRPLNDKGKEKMALEALGMKRLKLPIEAIVSSPYLRARQTAEAVARVYRLDDRFTESDRLEPGASFDDLRKALKGIDGERVMVVGHQPELGHWLGELIGAGAIPMGKGMLAWLSLDQGEVREGRGSLKALLPADLLIAAGRTAAAGDAGAA
jgi:phosphohistidine phosphatase